MSTMLLHVVIGFSLLFAAIWQATQGDWLPAIFLAILWHGYGNNVGHTITGNLLRGVRR